MVTWPGEKWMSGSDKDLGSFSDPSVVVSADRAFFPLPAPLYTSGESIHSTLLT